MSVPLNILMDFNDHSSEDDFLASLDLTNVELEAIQNLEPKECATEPGTMASSTISNYEATKIQENLLKTTFQNLPPPEMPTVPNPRFATTSEIEMECLFDARQAKATKKNTSWGMKIFQDWNMEKTGEILDISTVPVPVLANKLRRFYTEARPKSTEGSGEQFYHKNSIISIRAAINRHLSDIQRDVDIVRDKQFKTANGTLDGIFKERTRLGLSKPTNHKKVIEPHDLEKIATYLKDARTSPIILRQCVWYYISLHFVSRGTEFHHQLKIDSFTFNEDDSGVYVTLNHETTEKNHQGGLSSSSSSGMKRMYATGTDTCPVSMLRLFIAKTDPNAVQLFNKYNKDGFMTPSLSEIWYDNNPLARRTFSNFLSDICKSANVDTKYTPHCLRATAIQFLSDAGYEARHIMFMSGHRNESSLRSYNRSVSTQQKKSLSSALSTITGNVDVEKSGEMSLVPVTTQTNMIPHAGDKQINSLPALQNQTENKFQQITLQSSNTIKSTPGLFANSTFSGCTFNFNS